MRLFILDFYRIRVMGFMVMVLAEDRFFIDIFFFIDS